MDKYQMLDEIIIALDSLADARGVARCALMVDVLKRLDALKKGLHAEEEASNARIDMLKSQIKKLTEPQPLEDGEIREGGETYTLDFTPKMKEV